MPTRSRKFWKGPRSSPEFERAVVYGFPPFGCMIVAPVAGAGTAQRAHVAHAASIVIRRRGGRNFRSVQNFLLYAMPSKYSFIWIVSVGAGKPGGRKPVIRLWPVTELFAAYMNAPVISESFSIL
jgi:hypothetical protein